MIRTPSADVVFSLYPGADVVFTLYPDAGIGFYPTLLLVMSVFLVTGLMSCLSGLLFLQDSHCSNFHSLFSPFNSPLALCQS